LAEAEAVCEQILEALPNCLKANLILGHIWLHTGREEESHGPFRVAQALDPENHVAVDLLGKESPLAREPVVIPQLDELPVVAPKPEDLISVMEEPALGEAVAETELPDWLTQLRSAGMMEEEEEIVEEDSLPDWLTAIEPAVEPFTEPAAEELPTAEVPAPEPPTEAEELPDWLAVLESEEAEEPPTEERPKVETLAEEPVAPEAADRDVPEWLMQLRTGVEQDLTDIGEVDVSVSPLDEDTERFASREVPEWLQDVQEESDLSGEAISEEDLLSSTIEPVEETPEWLAAFQVEEPATPEVETPAEPEATEIVEAAEPAEEIPDWLTALQAEEPATPEIEAPIEPEEIEIVEAAEPAEEIPDWLAVLQAEEPAAPEVSGAPAEPEVTDTDLWREIMREEGLEEMIEAIPAEVEGLPEEVEPAEEIPDWLAALHVEEPGAPEVTEPPAEPEVAEAAEPAEEIPDWLAALHVEEPGAPEVTEPPAEPDVAEAAEPTEEIPDWLAALHVEEPGAPEVTGPPAEPEVTEIAAEVAEPAVTEAPPEEAEAAEEIPDWLAALQAKEPVAPEVAEPPVEPEEIEVAEAGEPAKELPDWLAALQADEPAAPEVAEAPAGLAADTDLWREIMREEGLEEMIEAAPAEAKDLTEEAEPAEEIPEWLAALQEEEPVSPEVAEAPAELAADTDLWREIMREAGLEEMIETAPAEAEDLEEAEPAEEIPDWLAALQEEEPAAPEVAEAPAELAADTDLWREIMREEGLEEMIEAAPAEDLEEAEPAEEIPDWLAALQAEELVSPEVAEAPAELAADTDLWREIMREEGLEEMIEAAPAEAEDLEEAEPAEEIPDWLAALQEEEPTVPQVAPGPAEPEVIEVSAEAVESIEEEELVGEVTVKAEVVEPEVAVEEAEEVELAPEEEAVPDWLASWQEEVELEETAKVAVEAEVEKVPAVEVTAPEVTEKVEVEPVSFAVSSYLSRLDADPDDHEVRLALARAYRDEKKPNNAFEQFQTLVSSGHLVQELLSDLEGLCASHANDARWHQLLGDAYVRTNQLADALNAYRAAQEAILHR
jgi:NAD-dependent oxidoreductase involved in siderophore biosynthesis